MSFITPSASSSSRRSVKRAAVVLSAGLFVAALSLGGSVSANAAGVLLNTTTATAGGSLTVSAIALTPGEAVTVTLDTVSPSLATGFADGAGNYTTDVTVPAGTSVGVHTMNLVSPSTSTSENFTVIATPTVTPATSSVTASAFGTTGVKLTFSGFTPGDSVQFGGGNGGSGGAFSAAPVTVGITGVVSYTVTSADFGSGAAVSGVYTVNAQTTNGAEASDTATITVAADPATPVKRRAPFTG